MKTILPVPFLALSLAWGPGGCGGTTPPAPVVTPPTPAPLSWDAGPPTPFVPPPVTPPDNSCQALCANLSKLKCPEYAPTCDADCARRDANLAKLGSKPSDHSCVAKAPGCVAARTCR